MSDQFLAEIRMFGFNFPPTGWAYCNGQIMPISQNTALFALLGTTYGGDGKSNFALPNLSGNVAMHPGQGQGLSLRDLGEQSGTPTVTLLQSEIPVHNHMMQALNANASTAVASGNALAKGRYSTGPTSGAIAFYNTVSTFVTMDPLAIGIAGGGLPHNNLMPYLGLNFCIALQGVFPQRP